MKKNKIFKSFLKFICKLKKQEKNEKVNPEPPKAVFVHNKKYAFININAFVNKKAIDCRAAQDLNKLLCAALPIYTKTVIDMEGVEEISGAFAHELFSNLFLKFEKGIIDRVFVVNANQKILEYLSFAIISASNFSITADRKDSACEQ